MSAQIHLGATTVQVGAVQTLFTRNVIFNYDITRDGQRFLVVYNEEAETPAPLTLVVNWLGEIGKK